MNRFKKSYDIFHIIIKTKFNFLSRLSLNGKRQFEKIKK